MHSLRALIRENRCLALALLALALCIKAAIPAGFMVSSTAASAITVTICSDVSAGFKQMQIAIPGKAGDGSHSKAKKSGEHCAFSGLAKVAVGGADAFILALAFAFILLLCFAPSARLPFGQVAYLRPPLRGPPARA